MFLLWDECLFLNPIDPVRSVKKSKTSFVLPSSVLRRNGGRDLHRMASDWSWQCFEALSRPWETNHRGLSGKILENRSKATSTMKRKGPSRLTSRRREMERREWPKRYEEFSNFESDTQRPVKSIHRRRRNTKEQHRRINVASVQLIQRREWRSNVVRGLH